MSDVNDVLECTDPVTGALVEIVLEHSANAEQAAMAVASLTAFTCLMFNLPLSKVLQLAQALQRKASSTVSN